MSAKPYSLLNPDQLAAIEWTAQTLALTGGCAIWADVGMGKTVIAATALDRLMKDFLVGRVLISAPKRVASRVWRDEVAEWAHLNHLTVSRIVGTAEERLEAIRAPADIYTITRENTSWLERQFVEAVPLKDGRTRWVQRHRWPWDTVVLDESQGYKSQSANRWKSMDRLRRYIPRILELTASPMPHGHEDLWAQMKLLDGGARLHPAEKDFRKHWYDKDVKSGVVEYGLKGSWAAEEIERRVSDIVLVMRDAQPPVPTNWVRVEMTTAERKAYMKMARTSVLEHEGRTITAVNAGVLWGKLLQLANGAVYYETGKWVEVHKQKLEALWELLESLPKPVVIGYGFEHDLTRLLAAAPSELGRFALLRSERSLDAWRRGEIDYGIMHPGSAGHGLNDLYVSGSENIVWFGLTTNFEFYQQLNGRLAGGHRRKGKNVVIHHIVCDGTIDEDCKQLLSMRDADQLNAKIRIADRWRRTLLDGQEFRDAVPSAGSCGSDSGAAETSPIEW